MITSVLNAQSLFIAASITKYFLVEVSDSGEEEVKSKDYTSVEEQSEEEVETISKDYAFNEETYIDDNWFQDIVKIGETFVLFYHTDMCHCQFLLDEWRKLSTRYAQDKFTTMTEVNCKETRRICQTEGIIQFPVIWRYR